MTEDMTEVNAEKERTGSIQRTIGIGIIVSILGLIGIGVWFASIGVSQTTFTFVVESDTSWSGAFGTIEEGQRTEEGSGSASFAFHGSIASAAVQKQTEHGFLTVKILKNGNSVASQTTTASYGVVTVVSD
jgi:hypothetical protein